MPVIEHAVHEKVRIGEGWVYGCHNRPSKFKPHYWAPERRVFPDGSFEVMSVRVPHSLSHNCRFDLSLADPACKGCDHRGEGLAYTERVQALGK